MTHMTSRSYRTIINENALLTDGRPCVTAEHPDIEGCLVHGATKDEALERLDAARGLLLGAMQAAGEKIPVPAVVGFAWLSAIRTSPSPSPAFANATG